MWRSPNGTIRNILNGLFVTSYVILVSQLWFLAVFHVACPLDNIFAHWLYFFQSLFVGTVFREPILCQNIPRIVPGNILLLILLMKARHLSIHISSVSVLSYRLEETHLYWQTCLW